MTSVIYGLTGINSGTLRSFGVWDYLYLRVENLCIGIFVTMLHLAVLSIEIHLK